MPEFDRGPHTLDDLGRPAWITGLASAQHDPNHLVHVVRDLDPAEALELLGVAPESIEPCALSGESPHAGLSLARAAIHPLDPTAVLLAARSGDWTVVYDDLGETLFLWHLPERPPLNATAVLSDRGGVAATANTTINGQTTFAYAVGGELLVVEDWLEPDDLDEDTPAEVRAAVEAAGVLDSGDDEGLHLRAVCALANLPHTLDDLRGLPLLIGRLDH